MIFKRFFDSRFENLVDELGVTRFRSFFSAEELATIRNDGRVGLGSKPEEAAARAFRDLVILNQKIPIETRLEVTFEKLSVLKSWHFDDKVNVDLHLGIKEKLENLLRTYVGEEYEREYYDAVSKTGVITPIVHDTLRTIALGFLYGGKKLGILPSEAAYRLFWNVIMKQKGTYGRCVVGGEQVLELLSPASPDS